MSAVAEVDGRIGWMWQDALDLATVTENTKLAHNTKFTSGSGWGQVDLAWHTSSTLASSASDPWDLTALTQTIFGETVTYNFAEIKVIYIENTATSSGEDLLIDATVANGFIAPWNATTKISIPAGSPFGPAVCPNGWAVTSGTADILKITNEGSGSITYNILLVGVSA